MQLLRLMARTGPTWPQLDKDSCISMLNFLLRLLQVRDVAIHPHKITQMVRNVSDHGPAVSYIPSNVIIVQSAISPPPPGARDWQIISLLGLPRQRGRKSLHPAIGTATQLCVGVAAEQQLTLLVHMFDATLALLHRRIAGVLRPYARRRAWRQSVACGMWVSPNAGRTRGQSGLHCYLPALTVNWMDRNSSGTRSIDGTYQSLQQSEYLYIVKSCIHTCRHFSTW